MDRLFLFGVALLPFENFFFAPSAGFAALSPLVFFVYAVLQRQYFAKAFKRYFFIFFLVLICGALSCIAYIIFDSFQLENTIDTVSTLILGVSCLYSFDIYMNQKKKSIHILIRVLLVSYFIALIIGLIELIAVRFGIGSILSFFEFVMKRCYLPRVQFMFSEPSFTTMHLFGVLLPFYIVSKERRILWLIAGFIAISLLSESSLRMVVDALVVSLIVLVNYADWRKARTLFVAIAMPFLLIGMVFFGIQLNPRFGKVVDGGFDSDASAASRTFRIEAVAFGLIDNPSSLLFGYGAGNSWAAIRSGYDRALQAYDNAYTYEVMQLGRSDNFPSSVFCMYARLAAEYGLPTLLVIFIALGRLARRVGNKDWRLLILICAYLYVQFDSYCFYTIWIVIALAEYFRSEVQTDGFGSCENRRSCIRF